ncbi:MAG: hypothetical protein HOW73_35040 [Polyangiaceae bacterium]|nr:hypothetical protein [Polyangiaceae bacterium]
MARKHGCALAFFSLPFLVACSSETDATGGADVTAATGGSAVTAGGGGAGGDSTSSETSTGASGGAGGAPEPVSLRIAVLSDLNGSYGSTTYDAPVHDAIGAILGGELPDLVLVTGDMVAGQQGGLDYEAMWSGFHDAVTDPLREAGIPVAVTPGNHDASGYAGFEDERAIFVSQWSDPARVPEVEFIDDADYPLRYSFVYKGAFFLSLDATTIGPLSADQRGWVAEQLAAASEYPIKIAYGHVPIHSVTVGREEEILDDAELESIFREADLTVYVSGHQHGYYPGARDGLRLVSTSCLGSGPRALIGTSDPTPRSILRLVVEDGELTSLEAFSGPSFDTIIDRSTLPEELSYGGKSVLRDDLAGF